MSPLYRNTLVIGVELAVGKVWLVSGLNSDFLDSSVDSRQCRTTGADRGAKFRYFSKILTFKAITSIVIFSVFLLQKLYTYTKILRSVDSILGENDIQILRFKKLKIKKISLKIAFCGLCDEK